jgi:tetratricopeptide (TPR) repeat protein
MAKGEYNASIEQFNKALKIELVAYASSPNHSTLATSYNNLGAAYAYKGEYDAAIEQFNKALNILLVAYASSPNHPYIANTYNNLGFAYRAKGCNNELLNNPELIKILADKYGMNKAIDIGSLLSLDLINEVIENNDHELLLAGALSVQQEYTE